MIKLLHTSDWHLGHYLHGHDRYLEHQAFLDWLVQACSTHAVDALVVAGDIFDAANPPAKAQAMYYRCLAQLHQACPNMDILVVGGNHDSAMRLDAPTPLLSALNVTVVGGLPKINRHHLDLNRLCIPIHNAKGEIKAWCAALPFLRPADLPRMNAEANDPLIEGVRARYAEVFAAVREKRQPGQAIIATGHCYMAHSQLSELSERKVLRGNQHALPVDIFPDDVAYVALGHLHRPQAVGKRQSVRYSGSPLPLSMAEQHYPHQAVLVSLEADSLARYESIRVPRTVELYRLPDPENPQPWAAVESCLQALPEKSEDQPPETWPYLEVIVQLDKPQPNLRQRVNQLLETKAVRLVKLTTHYTGTGRNLADSAPAVSLADLKPEQVFWRKYQSLHQNEPSQALQDAFFELLETVENGGKE